MQRLSPNYAAWAAATHLGMQSYTQKELIAYTCRLARLLAAWEFQLQGEENHITWHIEYSDRGTGETRRTWISMIRERND